MNKFQWKKFFLKCTVSQGSFCLGLPSYKKFVIDKMRCSKKFSLLPSITLCFSLGFIYNFLCKNTEKIFLMNKVLINNPIFKTKRYELLKYFCIENISHAVFQLDFSSIISFNQAFDEYFLFLISFKQKIRKFSACLLEGFMNFSFRGNGNPLTCSYMNITRNDSTHSIRCYASINCTMDILSISSGWEWQ